MTSHRRVPYLGILLLALATTSRATATQSDADPRTAELAAILHAAHPTATVDMDRGLLRFPGGEPERVEVHCVLTEPWDEHEVTVASVQFPTLTTAAVEKELPVREARARARASLIVVLRRNPAGADLPSRTAPLDPRGDLADCTELQPVFDPLMSRFPHLDLVEPTLGPAVPMVEVFYRALYEYGGGLGVIEWLGMLDTRTMRYSWLLPFAVSLENPAITEVFEIRRPSPREFVFVGTETGGRWRYTCPAADACHVPPEEVLGWVGQR